MRKQSQNKKKIILGVTGSFGSGKTTLAGIFGSFGAGVLNADSIAHQVILPRKKAYYKIVSLFGRGMLKKNGFIDRKKLSQVVFKKNAALKQLNKIVHPQVIKVIRRQIKESKKKIIVLDAPLLIEAGLTGMVDSLIVVKINRRTQIKRLRKKLLLTRSQILARIKQQMPLEEKLRLADFVIDNNGTLEETKKQVKAIIRRLFV